MLPIWRPAALHATDHDADALAQIQEIPLAVRKLTNAEISSLGAVPDLSLRVSAQVVNPGRVFRRATLSLRLRKKNSLLPPA